tara:strand:- start:62 stop:796 length:735 start_codon:yes stop_codon:yes gene_type:complete
MSYNDVELMENIIRSWMIKLNANMERLLVKVKEFKSYKVDHEEQLNFWRQATDIIKIHGYEKSKDVLMKDFETHEPPKKLGYFLNQREETCEDFGEYTWERDFEFLIELNKKMKKNFCHSEKLHIYAYNMDLENVEKYHNKISDTDIEELEIMTERDENGKDIVISVEDFKANTFEESRLPKEKEKQYEKGEGIRQLAKVIKNNHEYRNDMIFFVKQRIEYTKDPIEFYTKKLMRVKAELAEDY